MFECVGQDEVQVLIEHVGKVEDGYSWNEVKRKIKEAIMKQTNKASAVFKLFMEIHQENLTFGEWYPQIEKQADRVNWEDFGREDAIVLAILYQSNNPKLKAKILAADDIDYNKTIRLGLALEQSSKRADAMTRTNKSEFIFIIL